MTSSVLKSGGYTLIELMVVVAIVGIISAIAYPSYQGYMEDTYQAQAMADLQQCSTRLERYYSNDFTYVGADTDGVCTLWSPSDGPVGNKKYTLSYESLTQTSFTIRVTPVDQGECVEVTANGTQSSC